MTPWLNQSEQKAWRYFLNGVNRILEGFDQSLTQSHGIPLTDYEILVFLSEAPGHRLRMSEIADRVLVSRSRLTYRVDRLVEAGLVVRAKAEDDKRGLFAQITEAGMSLLEAAADTHVRDVRALLMDHIPDGSLPSFTATWESVVAHSDPRIS